MSTTIDQQVVEFRFDNKQFERNVSTTMSTLEKLKQKLNFNGSVKGMDGVTNAAKNASGGMSNLGSAVDAVSLKFQPMQVFAVTALTRISNAAITAGNRITKALMIDPVKTGFSEYETQINSTQTILANVGQKGKTLEDVSKALNELNTYADKTIYNFTEMTRNIGLFTNAGVGLDESVSAIKGFSNAAAMAGTDATRTAGAMYQLSQAMSSGKVQLMDWRSLEQANITGERFQETIKETARAHGIAIDSMIKEEGSLRDTLSKGWLTADLMAEALEHYTLSTETMTEAEQEAARAKMKSNGYTDEQIDKLFQLGTEATNAATKVKTFTQLWDTLKESAQSGWSKTWQLIFGNFYEAQDLFTGLSDFFGGIIGKISDFRNAILESALGKSFSAIGEKINAVTKPAAKAVEVVTDLGNIVDKVIRGDYGNGKARFDKLTEEGYNWCKVQNKVNETLGCSKRYTEEQIEAQDKLLGKQGESTEKTKEQKDETVKLNDEQKNNLKTLAAMTEAELKAKGYTEEQIEALKELGVQAKKLGIPVDEFIDKIDEITGRWLLINSFKNIGKGIVDVFNAMKTAWQDVFPPKTIEERAEQLFNLIGGFHKLTSYLVGVIYDGDKLTETGEKLVRTFKGVFAIIDIITTIVGGGFKIAIKAVAALLGKFDLDILDVTAAIGDAIVNFRNWIDETFGVSKAMDILVPLVKSAAKFIGNMIKAVKNSEWFKKFASYVETAADGLSKLFASVPDMGSFKNLVSVLKDAGSAIKTWLKSLKESDNIPADIIAGLINGIRNGVPKVVSAVFELAKEILSSICEVLGIHSPSIEFQKIGEFSMEGFANGLKAGAVKVWDAIKGMANSILEWIKNLDVGSVLTIAFGVGMFAVIKDISATVANLVKPFEAAGNMCTAIGGAFTKVARSIDDLFDTIKGNIKATTWQKRGKAMLYFAGAIAILAASVYVLSKIDALDLLKAVAAIAALATVIVVVSKALGKLDVEDGLKLGQFALVLLSMSGAIFIVASALKKLAELNGSELIRGGIAIAAISGVMVGLIAATKLVGNDIGKIGFTLIKMAAAMALMVWVAKLASGLDAVTAIKGGIAILAFGGVMAGLVYITKLFNKDANKVGGTLLKMSFAMVLMIGVMKLASTLDAEDATKGGLAIVAFSAIFTGLIAITKLFNKDAKKVGSSILAMSAAMVLMIGVVALAAKMDVADIIKGSIAVAAFGGIITGLVAATNLAPDKTLKRVGTTLLMMSISIAIMAVVAALLGLLNTEHLIKGVTAVTIMGTLIAAMIWATRGATDCKSNLIAMTVVIATLAIAIAALTLIDTTKLLTASTALGIVMGMFAVMTKASSAATGSIKTVVVMTVVIALIAGALFLLSSLPIEASLSASAAMSILLLSLAASITIVSKAGAVAGMALVAIGVMTLVVAAIAGILYLMQDMPVDSTLANAAALSTVLATLAIACGIVSLIPAPAAISGALGLAAFIGIMAAVVAAAGALSLIPGFNTLIANGGETLGLVGYAIGNFVGSILGGLSAGATSGLPDIGKNLSSFMDEAEGFITGVTKLSDSNIVSNVKALAEAIYILSAAAGRNGQADWSKALFGDNSLGTFGKDLADFGESMNTFITNLTQNGAFDETKVATVKCACDAIKTLTEASSGINGQADWSKSIFGDNSLATFGTHLPELARNIATFAATLGTFDETKVATVKCACDAIKALATAATTLPAEGGWAQKLLGDNSLTTFGAQLPELARNLTTFAATLGTFDEAKVATVKCACDAIKALSNAASGIDGQAEWSKTLFGDNSLATFGYQLPGLGRNLSSFATNLGTFDEATVSTVACAGNAIKALSEAASGIDGQAEWAKKLFGDNGLASFGDQLASVGSNLAAFVKNLGTFTGTQVSTVEAAVKAISALAMLANADLKGAKKNIEGFGDKLETFAGNFKTFCEDMPSTTSVDAAVTGLRSILSTIEEVSAANVGSLGALADNLRNLGSEAVDKFIGAFTSQTAKTDVKDAADALADEAVEGLDGLDDDAEDAGEDLGDGLVRGIKSKYTAAYNAGYALGQKAVKGEKDGQKSNSPSKLTIQAGKWFGEGLVIGIKKMGDQVYEASHSLGDTAVKSLSSTVSRLAAAVDSDMDVQPTIRPVLDLSNVRSGASAINGMLGVGPSVGVMTNIGAISTMMNRRGQNGSLNDVVSAIGKLEKSLDNAGSTTNNIINGVTYDSNSEVGEAVRVIARALLMEGRV